MIYRHIQVDGDDASRQARDQIVAELYQQWSRKIKADLLRLGVPREQVEDACQEVLTKMVEVADRLRNPQGALAYALLVAKTVARRYRREPRFEELDDNLDLPAASFVKDPVVERAIAQLPKPLATAVELVYFQGNTYEEAAATVHCHKRSMKKRVQNALKKLRALFIPQITAGIFFESAASGKRFTSARIPAGTYRVGIHLHNQSPVPVFVQAKLTGAGTDFETTRLKLPQHASIDQLVVREFSVRPGRYNGRVTICLDGYLLPQYHPAHFDVA